MRESTPACFLRQRPARTLRTLYTAFMDLFYVGRWKRWVFIEPLSEAATLGLAGLIVLLALAVPAFRETADEDWLKKSELAVTFLDRYGNPIGSRGIKHQRLDTAGGFSGQPDQGRRTRPRTAAFMNISASMSPAPSARLLPTRRPAASVKAVRRSPSSLRKTCS